MAQEESSTPPVVGTVVPANNGSPSETRAPVFPGDVMFTLGREIHEAGRRLRELMNFERRVFEAAKSPSGWLLLREELSPRSGDGG